MIEISEAGIDDISTIQKVANLAWPHAFREILTEEQIEYMMDMMYSTEAITNQMNNLNHRFFIGRKDNIAVGYMSIEHNCENSSKTKIHKAYILPEYQRQGLGKLLFDMAIRQALENNDKGLFLNVNKYNKKAIDFYHKMDFILIKEEVIDIGNGFVMDDYVFEKQVDI